MHKKEDPATYTAFKKFQLGGKDERTKLKFQRRPMPP
ncbi:hypothetical protein [Caudoviricetes sp.]|nr:hypothetical protein [Caudoviricetes sp.]